MKRNWIIAGWVPIIILGVLLFNRCKNTSGNVQINLKGDPFETLSEYGFFVGELKSLLPNDGVIPYDLNSSLFTDYAHKARFVWMPKGSSAKYNATETLDFPKGTVLIKNFFYENDERDASKGRRIIETRLLINKEKGWETTTYVWNDTQTEATLEIAGATKNVEWINTKGKAIKVAYSVPNKNQCKNCHNVNDVIMPIGPKVRNINKLFTYVEGAKNQLDKWAEAGYLSGYDSKSKHPRLSVWNDTSTGTLDDRAKAYLEINCAHCHSNEGSANTSGLFLTTLNTDPNRWGICKSPVAAGRGAGNKKVDIQPGDAEGSILHYRMNSTNPGFMMPELGRKLIHEEGVALIREWINAMPPQVCEAQ